MVTNQLIINGGNAEIALEIFVDGAIPLNKN